MPSTKKTRSIGNARPADEPTPDAARLQAILKQLARESGRTQRSLQDVVHKVRSNAANPLFYARLADSLFKRGCPQRAAVFFRRALTLDADCREALLGLGRVERHLGNLMAAADTLQQLLDLAPEDPAAHLELARVRHQQREPFLAEYHVQRTLAAQPDDVAARRVLAQILHDAGRDDEAVGAFDNALQQDPGPQDDQTRLLRGLIALQAGRWQEGWEGFAHRPRRYQPPAVMRLPTWDGRPARLLVRCEGNLRDDLMFASCLPELVELCPHVIVQCDARLWMLFRRSFPAASCLVRGREEVAMALAPQAETELGSLPALLRPDDESFPDRPGYLQVSATQTAQWRRWLAGIGEGLKVGVCGDEPIDAGWGPLLEVPGVQFVRLPDGLGSPPPGDRLEIHGVSLTEVTDRCPAADLDRLAALLKSLDLVITVPGLVAHLAGAVGAETWTYIGRQPSWRWLRGRDRSPWYPTMRVWNSASTDTISAMQEHLGWLAVTRATT